jgi:hypothetical protein
MKYNKREIMKKAWSLVQTCGVDMSTALKSAWALAKAIIEAEGHTDNYSGKAKVVVNDWVKYGKNRTYIEVRHYTNAWNLKHTTKIGYVDNLTGAFVAV